MPAVFLTVFLFSNQKILVQDSFAKPSVQTENQEQLNIVNNDSVSSVENVIFSEQSTPVLSIRLKIPKINVDAAVESVSITTQGALGVPKDPNNVAWYNLGPYPGDIGNAVITGHYGRWKNGQGSVFDNLKKLALEDELYIEDQDQNIMTFVVKEIKTYNQNDSVPEIFVSNDGKAHLNLITCDGIWDSNSKSFSERLVVFTEMK